MFCFKRIIIMVAILASAFFLQNTKIYADEPASEDIPVTTVEGEETASEESEKEEAITTTMISEITDSVASTESINKYYRESKYDTDGNATLIKEETVIYNSEEMQFIAVTTKDGSVFYVLINYSAAGDEDNVYFLNKVDDYDLYALLYSGDDDKVIDPDAAAKAAEDATREEEVAVTEVPSENVSDPVTSTEHTVPTSSLTSMLIVVIIAMIAVGGLMFFKTYKKKKSKASLEFDDGDLELDEE